MDRQDRGVEPEAEPTPALESLVQGNANRQQSIIFQGAKKEHSDQCEGQLKEMQSLKQLQGKEEVPEWNTSHLQELFKKFSNLSTHWSIIKKHLNHWPENFLKNKFNGALRKFHRRILGICFSRSRKHHKEVKFSTIVSIIHYTTQAKHSDKRILAIALGLQQKIFHESLELEKGNENMDSLGVLEKQIHTFTRENKVYMMNIGKKKIQPKIPHRELASDRNWHHTVIVLRSRNPSSQTPQEHSREDQKQGGITQWERGTRALYLDLNSQTVKKQEQEFPQGFVF